MLYSERWAHVHEFRIIVLARNIVSVSPSSSFRSVVSDLDYQVLVLVVCLSNFGGGLGELSVGNIWYASRFMLCLQWDGNDYLG